MSDKHQQKLQQDLHKNLQQKWDLRYRDAEQPNAAVEALRENRHLLPPRGRALELACGLGGNSLLLAESGLEVEAVDLSPVAISKLKDFSRQKGLKIDARVKDIEKAGLPAGYYDMICVSAFLDRSLCPAILNALAPGGLLIYQTFTRDKVSANGAPAGGPSNPDFLLERGELLRLFADLQPLVYREEQDCGLLSEGLRNQAYLIARKPPGTG